MRETLEQKRRDLSRRVIEALARFGERPPRHIVITARGARKHLRWNLGEAAIRVAFLERLAAQETT